MISVTVFAIIGFTITEHISFYVGLLEACIGFGDSFGPLLAEYISQKYSYSYQFLFFIIVLAALGWTTNKVLSKDLVDGKEDKMRVQIRDPINLCSLVTNKLFFMGLVATFINLALFVSLDPILSDHLINLGVDESNVGVYFFIYSATYCISSLLLDKFVISQLKYPRLCIIYGFVSLGIGFLFIGPTKLLNYFIGESPKQVVAGLLFLGIGASASFVPIYAELSESVKDKFHN